MDWGNIFGGVASAAGGGVFGLVGSAIGQGVKYFRTRQEQAFQREQWKHEENLIRLKMEAVGQQGSWEGLVASVKADAAPVDTYKWVNAAKSLYRPALTSALVYLCYRIFLDFLAGLAGDKAVLAGIFTGPELKQILCYIVYSLVFAASTAVVWWYSERAFAPPGLKNR